MKIFTNERIDLTLDEYKILSKARKIGNTICTDCTDSTFKKFGLALGIAVSDILNSRNVAVNGEDPEDIYLGDEE